jgi:hypothetical protein
MQLNDNRLQENLEWKLLIYLCRQGLSKTALSLKSEIDLNQIDWDRLLNIVSKNRVRSLAHNGLVQSPIKNLVPIWVIEKLKEAHVERTVINMRHAKELKHILCLLCEKGVHPIPFKGLVLEQYAYKKIGLREMSDIDMLIDIKDFPDIEALMLSRNYVPTVQMSEAFKPTYFKQNFEYNFDLYDGAQRVFHVEPHWQIGSVRWQTNLDYNDILPFTRKDEFFGETISLLTPEGLLITTSLHHGGDELWSSLKYICDIAAILQSGKDEMNWNHLLAKTDELKVTNIILLGISLSVRLFDSHVPKEIRQLIESKKISKHADNIEAQLRQTGRKKNIGSYLEHVRFHFSLRKKMSTKLKVVYHHVVQIFVPTIFDHQDEGNAGKKYWQLFITKPFRIWRQHVKRN